MKLIISIVFLFVLLGCQTQKKEHNPQQSVTKKSLAISKEVFEVKAGKEMVQIESKEIHNGYLYTLTNNGISPDSDDIKKKMITVEINGQQEPHRLKDITPSQCSEISYTDSIVNNYRTWIDILSCPYYEGLTNNKGLLIINKSIQGTERFFGATLYKTIASYTQSDISSYHELNLSESEIQDIDRFISGTEIITLDRDGCCDADNSSRNKYSKIAAYNLAARHFVAHKKCHHPLNKFYFTSLFITSGVDMKSDDHSKKLKVFMDQYKNEAKEMQEESSMESMCQFYKNQMNDDIQAFLSTLFLNKPTSDIQDKGLFEVTNAYEARDVCGFKVSEKRLRVHMKEHDINQSHFGKNSLIADMFYYYGIKSNLEMNNMGRSLWCEEMRANNKVLLP